MKIRRAVVILGPVNWGTLKQRYQYLAEGISESLPVVYVEPYASAPAVLRNSGLRAHYDLTGSRLRLMNPSLIIATPPALPFLPFQNRSVAVNGFNQIPLALWIRFVLGALGLSPWLVLSHQFHFFMKRLLSADTFAYDCSDNHSAAPWYGSAVGRLEALTAKAADIVFCSAASLAEKMKPHCSSPVLVRNGVDPSRFGKTRESRGAKGRHGDPGRGKIEAVYIGTLSKWFDWKAVEAMVLTGEIRVHLVGPFLRDSMPSDLSPGDDLVVHGVVEHDAIPDLIAAMDVAIIPFKLDEVTRFTDPVKVYEYLAAGIPIVSTALPEISRFADLIEFADPSGFPAAVKKAAESDSVERIAERVAAANENSWSVRVAALLEAVGVKRAASRRRP